MAELLAADVRATMPPYPQWFAGRDAVLAALAESWDPGSPHYAGTFRMVRAAANGRLAAAAYVRRPGGTSYGALGLGVLEVAGGRIVEITAVHDPALFPAFGLPAHLDR